MYIPKNRNTYQTMFKVCPSKSLTELSVLAVKNNFTQSNNQDSNQVRNNELVFNSFARNPICKCYS